MRILRKNGGFTLVELLVTIVVGSLATAAAATVLILGLRIYNNANETALKQNEVNIGITVIENLVAEAEITKTDSTNKLVYDSESDEPLLYADEKGIWTRAGVLILPDVTDFSAVLDGKLLQFSFKYGDEVVNFVVYCRRVEETTEPSSEPSDPPPGGENPITLSLSRPVDITAILASALEDNTLSLHVRTFLNVLASQQGSTGRIQTPEGEGEYYSEWYIGGYESNPDWSGETPWCACFVSWALDQCCGYIQDETPRYANVDTFCTDLVTSGNWKDSNPVPGDLIFFDWSPDGDYNPEHIGVVIGSDDSRVYTIEGNVDNAVALRSYDLEDERILGYGLVSWTK